MNAASFFHRADGELIWLEEAGPEHGVGERRHGVDYDPEPVLVELCVVLHRVFHLRTVK